MNSYASSLSQSSIKVLIIGYVWPETNASAAGLRDWALMEQFQAAGWHVHYASPAKPNAFSEKLECLGIPTFSCPANDPRFDTYVSDLQPDVVLFDRFVTEEQFGWRVEEHCPGALRVLDTQDLHFLRRAREAAHRDGWALDRIREASPEMIERFAADDFLREVASIYRSDLTLVISSFEMELLTRVYGIPEELLVLQRLSYKSIQDCPTYEARKDFVSIGNFRHPPNADAALWLAREIWPAIRRRLPKAQLHLYGAYPSREMMQLTNEESGLIVKGQAKNQYETLRNYRVLLAPLRFGAGIKGKISDSWSVGAPVVTTPIGAEGMVDHNWGPVENWEGESWPGEIAESVEGFVDTACELYSRPELWSERQRGGLAAIRRYYDYGSNGRILQSRVVDARVHLEERRRRNLIGAMLRHDLHRGTKYFSKWIELKQTLKR